MHATSNVCVQAIQCACIKIAQFIVTLSWQFLARPTLPNAASQSQRAQKRPSPFPVTRSSAPTFSLTLQSHRFQPAYLESCLGELAYWGQDPATDTNAGLIQRLQPGRSAWAGRGLLAVQCTAAAQVRLNAGRLRTPRSAYDYVAVVRAALSW